jgi:hypothetical protein
MSVFTPPGGGVPQPIALKAPAGGGAAPGALAAPRAAAPLPGAVTPPSPAVAAAVQRTTGLPVQKALNIVNTPVTVGSVFVNNWARRAAEWSAKGNPPLASPADSPLIQAARDTPWTKLLGQGLRGEVSAFPEVLQAVGQGAPQTPVGRFTQQHPVATKVTDFLLSFPITEAMGAAQNEAVGLAGRGLAAASQATGAGERALNLASTLQSKLPILNRLPDVQAAVQQGRVADAATEIVNRSMAGMEQYYRDGARAAEDVRQTSQRYLKAGVPLGRTSEFTGQPVNKLDELVSDYMRAGNSNSKYADIHAINDPEVQRAAQAAQTLYDVRARAKAAVPNILAQGPEGLAWSQAAADLRRELAAPYAIPPETGAGTTLSAVLQRAREAGPAVIRAQAYNELGGAAADAALQGRRAAEVAQVADDARNAGIRFEDVQRIGDEYSRIFDNLGQHLVNFGLMDPDAYARLKGQYLPQLYLLTKGNPEDIGAYMKFLSEHGALTPEAATAAAKQGVLQSFPGRVGPRGFMQARELASFEQMNAPEMARAFVPEATPAAMHGIMAQSRAAGLGQAMEEISHNPEWAVPLEKGQLPAGKENWVPYPGKGPLEGMAIHPGINEVLRDAASPPGMSAGLQRMGVSPAAANFIETANRIVRKSMLAGPGTMANIVVGHYWFANAEAKMARTAFTPLEYARSALDLRNFERTGRTPDPYLSEFANRTDLYTKGATTIPKAAASVSGGYGLEGPAANLVRGAKALGGKYLSFTHDALAAGKFGLYRQLRRAGYDVDAAARMTRRATIDYTRVPRVIRNLDQGMVAPFITFGYRAAGLGAKMALRRPDLFATASGNRFTFYLDRIADAVARQRGQPETAVAAREQGRAGPVTFPIPWQPGRYAQAPLLAPLLHHFVGGGGTDLTAPLAHQLRSAFPVGSTLAGALTNVDLRGETPRQIVPPGTVPPGRELPGNVLPRLNWAARNLAPPLGGLESLIAARAGVTPYAQRGAAPQTPAQAALQFLTQTRTGTLNQLTPLSQQRLEALAPGSAREQELARTMKQQGGEHYGNLALDRLDALFSERARPDPAYTRAAGQRTAGQILTESENVRRQLPNIVYGSQYSGADREAAIQRQVDWAYALERAKEQHGLRPDYHALARAIGRPLGLIQAAP